MSQGIWGRGRALALVLLALIPPVNWRSSLPAPQFPHLFRALPTATCGSGWVHVQRPLKVCVWGSLLNLGLSPEPIAKPLWPWTWPDPCVCLFLQKRSLPEGVRTFTRDGAGQGRTELVAQQRKEWATMAGPSSWQTAYGPLPSQTPAVTPEPWERAPRNHGPRTR